MSASRIPIRALLAALALAGASLAAWADRLAYGTPTRRGHAVDSEFSSVRGLAFDGRYIYVADILDHLYDRRPRDNTGRVYIYDLDGNFVKRIPEVPPVRGVFFPHGAAVDGRRLWVTDYFGGRIYEYEVATGALLRSFASPVPNPIRLDFQPKTQTLWVVSRDDPRVYEVTLQGQVKSSFLTSGMAPDYNVTIDGRGDFWVSNARLGDMPPVWKRYSAAGVELQSDLGEPGWITIATDVNRRDHTLIRDLQPVWDAGRKRWVTHFQRIDVASIGGDVQGLAAPAVSCRDETNGAQAAAHFGGRGMWNCEDGGLPVSTGDRVAVEITGTVR